MSFTPTGTPRRTPRRHPNFSQKEYQDGRRDAEAQANSKSVEEGENAAPDRCFRTNRHAQNLRQGGGYARRIHKGKGDPRSTDAPPETRRGGFPLIKRTLPDKTMWRPTSNMYAPETKLKAPP